MALRLFCLAHTVDYDGIEYTWTFVKCKIPYRNVYVFNEVMSPRLELEIL